jgi:tetratricopeptide (TPR) repeat protein
VGFTLEARLLAATGQRDAGLDLLQKASASVDDRVACLRSLFEMAKASGMRQRATLALDAIVRAGCTDDQGCAAQLEWVGDQQRALGNIMSALAVYKRAREGAPGDEGVLAAIADIAAQAGLHGEALQYYRELAERNPAEGKWAKAVDQERGLLGKEGARERTDHR